MKQKPCKYCGGKNHTSLMCYDKPRTLLRKQGKYTNEWTKTRREWLKQNPPDHRGVWICALQLSQYCPIKLTASTITLDHKLSRSRRPDLRYELSNLQPACKPCNEVKGSRELTEAKRSITMRT